MVFCYGGQSGLRHDLFLKIGCGAHTAIVAWHHVLKAPPMRGACFQDSSHQRHEQEGSLGSPKLCPALSPWPLH